MEFNSSEQHRERSSINQEASESSGRPDVHRRQGWGSGSRDDRAEPADGRKGGSGIIRVSRKWTTESRSLSGIVMAEEPFLSSHLVCRSMCK
jgi:hypothetical protein